MHPNYCPILLIDTSKSMSLIRDFSWLKGLSLLVIYEGIREPHIVCWYPDGPYVVIISRVPV